MYRSFYLSAVILTVFALSSQILFAQDQQPPGLQPFNFDDYTEGGTTPPAPAAAPAAAPEAAPNPPPPPPAADAGVPSLSETSGDNGTRAAAEDDGLPPVDEPFGDDETERVARPMRITGTGPGIGIAAAFSMMVAYGYSRITKK